MAKVIDLDKDNSIYDESVIGLGNFDGLHIGHRNIIKTTMDIAKKENLKSSVLVFKQHTNEVFPHFPRYYISSLQDKINLLSDMGVDYIYIINFTYEFAQLTKEDFIFEFIQKRLNSNYLVCGPDYTFGKKSLGTTEDIREYVEANKIKACIVDYVKDNDQKVSSTLIRNHIINGEFEQVKTLLDRNYSVKGNVIHGFKIGSSELGYPTANIELNFRYIMPIEGVYLSYLIYEGEKYLSLTSIGTNPTITDNTDIKLEVYILDFNKTIYGEFVEIEFIKFIRYQIKFNSKSELIEKMNEDLDIALEYKKK